MIRILIVDDSETEIAILKHIIEENKDLEVIGSAKNGKEAVKLTRILKPDLITMDIQMPIMDGIEATRLIMMQTPTPIVVISSLLHDETLNATFRALDVGALSVLTKPFNITSKDFDGEKKRIIDTIRSMAEIKVIKRRNYLYKAPPKLSELIMRNGTHEILAIGASTGGTQALKLIFSKLRSDFSMPIVVVQHMMPGFISSFTNWLNANTELTVSEAGFKEKLKKGHVYFAPDHYHLKIQRENGALLTKLVKPTNPGFCPSISVLFESVAHVCGKRGVGMLLTGMGGDGAEGLLAIKKSGGHTIIQDKASSVVFGMAAEAEAIGAHDKMISLDRIAEYLTQLK